MKNLLDRSQKGDAKILLAQIRDSLEGNKPLGSAKHFLNLFGIFYRVMRSSQKLEAKRLIQKASIQLQNNNPIGTAKSFYYLFGLLYQLLSDDRQRATAKNLINQANELLENNQTLGSFKVFYNLSVLFTDADTYTYERDFNAEGDEGDNNINTDVIDTPKSFGTNAIVISIILGVIVGFGICKYKII